MYHAKYNAPHNTNMEEIEMIKTKVSNKFIELNNGSSYQYSVLDDYLTWLENDESVTNVYYTFINDTNGRPTGCMVTSYHLLDHTKNNYN